MMDLLLLQSQPSYVLTFFGFLLGIGLAVLFQQMISRTRSKTFKEDLERQLEGAVEGMPSVVSEGARPLPSGLLAGSSPSR